MSSPCTRPMKWLGFVGALCACDVEPAPAAASHPIAGTWVRVYPGEGAPDTLTLHAGGAVSGSGAGLDSTGLQYTNWKVGDVIMPGGFCIGEGDQRNGKRLWACQGFLLTGDTLALANQRRTVFIRAAASAAPHVDTAWTGPRETIAAPRPGEGVKVVPPESNR